MRNNFDELGTIFMISSILPSENGLSSGGVGGWFFGLGYSLILLGLALFFFTIFTGFLIPIETFWHWGIRWSFRLCCMGIILEFWKATFKELKKLFK